MSSTSDDPFQDLDDLSKVKDFVSGVTGGTAEIARRQILSQLYLAHKTKAAGDSLAAGVKALAEALERAFTNHAQALHEAASASETYARRLVWATWALVFATAALGVVAILQLRAGLSETNRYRVCLSATE